MTRREIVTLTNMCMVYDGNNVLVQDRVGDDYCGITFPGGHVEKGESFTDAVIREVFEETGLFIVEPQLCGIKDWKEDDGARYIVLFYKTDKFSGSIKSSDEGEIYWTDINKLQDMKLAAGMEKMLRVFLEDGISEYFFYREKGEWFETLK